MARRQEKVRREEDARERAELERAEKADRDTRQRALHDVTNDQTNTEVMDQLVQLINTGQVFDVMGRRRRQPKSAAERRAEQLNRSRSRTGLTSSSPTSNKPPQVPETLDGLLMDENCLPSRKSRPRERRGPGLPTGFQSRERLFDPQLPPGDGGPTNGSQEAQEALLQRLREI